MPKKNSLRAPRGRGGLGKVDVETARKTSAEAFSRWNDGQRPVWAADGRTLFRVVSVVPFAVDDDLEDMPRTPTAIEALARRWRAQAESWGERLGYLSSADRAWPVAMMARRVGRAAAERRAHLVLARLVTALEDAKEVVLPMADAHGEPETAGESWSAPTVIGVATSFGMGIATRALREKIETLFGAEDGGRAPRTRRGRSTGPLFNADKFRADLVEDVGQWLRQVRPGRAPSLEDLALACLLCGVLPDSMRDEGLSFNEVLNRSKRAVKEALARRGMAASG